MAFSFKYLAQKRVTVCITTPLTGWGVTLDRVGNDDPTLREGLEWTDCCLWVVTRLWTCCPEGLKFIVLLNKVHQLVHVHVHVHTVHPWLSCITYLMIFLAILMCVKLLMKTENLLVYSQALVQTWKACSRQMVILRKPWQLSVHCVASVLIINSHYINTHCLDILCDLPMDWVVGVGGVLSGGYEQTQVEIQEKQNNKQYNAPKWETESIGINSLDIMAETNSWQVLQK